MMRKTLLFVIIFGSLLALQAALTTSHVGEKDFLGYWSAAHLLLTGGDPYDPGALRKLQHSVRPEQVNKDAPPAIVWNPPWLILMLLPLGLLPFDLATLAWLFCNLVLVGLSLAMAWQSLAEGLGNRGFILALAAGFLYIGTLS
jgi:hypothetical protein